MHRFQVWVRLTPYQTAHVIISASSDYEAKMLAEAQYGSGSVLGYTRVND